MLALGFAAVVAAIYRGILWYAYQWNDGDFVAQTSEIPREHAWGLALMFAACMLCALFAPGFVATTLPGAGPSIVFGLIGSAVCAPAVLPAVFLQGIYGLPWPRAMGFVFQIQIMALIATICLAPIVVVLLLYLPT